MNKKSFAVFTRFLKNKNAYHLYLRNRKVRPLYYNYLDEAQTYISKAFTWSYTPQNYLFWETLHAEWIRSYLGIDSDSCMTPVRYAHFPITKRI